MIRGSPADIEAVPMRIISLARKALAGVAVHATGMLQNGRHLRE
jgi:hypothetical protein